MELSKRAKGLTPSPTLAISAKAKELKSKGIDVVSFGAGEPDFNTPDNIIQAAIQAMKEGQTKYTAASGIVEFKEAIVDKFKRDNNLNYDTNQITISLGAKHALYNFFQVVCDFGDEIIIPVPYWVSYPEQVKLAGAVPVYLQGNPDNSYKFSAKDLEAKITDKTKAVIINSPSNPAGTIYSYEELAQIAEVCKEHDILIVSDEIYEKLLYDGDQHYSIASISQDAYERTIVINGLSKPYSMTGWRIGFAAGNKQIIKAMTDVASHSTSNPVTFAQYGGIEALNGTQVELHRMKDEFEKRRNFMLEEIRNIDGFNPIIPNGAFYVFIDISQAIKGKYDSVDDWASDLLEKAKVAVIPGSGFGMTNFIRLSYASSLQQLEEGLKRIKEFVKNN